MNARYRIARVDKTPEEAREFAIIHGSSFRGTRLGDLVCPLGYDEEMIQWQTRNWLRFFTEDDTHILKAVDTKTGEIVGFCKWREVWHPARPSTTEAIASQAQQHYPEPVRLDSTVFERFQVGKKQVFAEALAHLPHYCYLVLLSTAPASQKSGIGRTMIRECLHWAAERDLPTYLESSINAQTWYRSLGFEDIATLYYGDDRELDCLPCMLLPSPQASRDAIIILAQAERTTAEAHRLADLHSEAFAYTPFGLRCYPNGLTSKVRDYWRKRYEAVVLDSAIHIVVARDSHSGELLGFVDWERRAADWLGSEYTPQEVEIMPAHDMDTDLVRLRRTGENATAKRCLLGTETCYLSTAVVKASHGGRAIGTRLLQACLDWADAERLPTYLFSSPQAYALYARLGFREIDHFLYADDPTCRLPLMLRRL
ncbi:uncharacterized protein L969DRAFT_94279 [Mixia osmundae IAM 14324]|uniref:N-acetyltransferase domain-containing protein n=1 Tax=Mixia osmundae (strain CBS 9802 / IAM 14324 / JCM 22182 / KY 12970) TaxID=764103 RepID=G7E8D7_MIXOS|nr:uncharacterized protein L969DRAFT_94279 [Mixia osmundae IAM 14324]KEI39200.1 hypothetical protein L969DRAFT_94279 [Mixia osmundae IAM 14324]GAA99097.1 hypothetical protein E5Q_05786 [Mixia osmundae IAM 14324]